MMSKKLRKESTLKKKIKELKQTSKGKAILKLIWWSIFFFVLFVFCIIATFFSNPTINVDYPCDDENTQNNLTDNKENIIDEETQKIKLLEDLASSNYDYEYEININGAKYLFNGSINGDINTGYKETSNGIIKYYIDKTGVYQQTTNDKILINDLYENINIEYLNLNNLVNKVKNLKFNVPEIIDFYYPTYFAVDDLNTYYISYAYTLDQKDNYVTIIRIEAKDESYRYTFQFDNVEVVNEN